MLSMDISLLRINGVSAYKWMLKQQLEQEATVELSHWFKKADILVGNMVPSLLRVSLQPVDFEEKRQYSLRVQVENAHISPRFFSAGPFRDEASVKIWVEDVDEPPVFERASYVMEVKEDAGRSTLIGSVSASDPDDKSSLIRCGAAPRQQFAPSWSASIVPPAFIITFYVFESSIMIYNDIITVFYFKLSWIEILYLANMHGGRYIQKSKSVPNLSVWRSSTLNLVSTSKNSIITLENIVIPVVRQKTRLRLLR